MFSLNRTDIVCSMVCRYLVLTFEYWASVLRCIEHVEEEEEVKTQNETIAAIQTEKSHLFSVQAL